MRCLACIFKSHLAQSVPFVSCLSFRVTPVLFLTRLTCHILPYLFGPVHFHPSLFSTRLACLIPSYRVNSFRPIRFLPAFALLVSPHLNNSFLYDPGLPLLSLPFMSIPADPRRTQPAFSLQFNPVLIMTGRALTRLACLSHQTATSRCIPVLFPRIHVMPLLACLDYPRRVASNRFSSRQHSPCHACLLFAVSDAIPPGLSPSRLPIQIGSNHILSRQVITLHALPVIYRLSASRLNTSIHSSPGPACLSFSGLALHAHYNPRRAY